MWSEIIWVISYANGIGGSNSKPEQLQQLQLTYISVYWTRFRCGGGHAMQLRQLMYRPSSMSGEQVLLPIIIVQVCTGHFNMASSCYIKRHIAMLEGGGYQPRYYSRRAFNGRSGKCLAWSRVSVGYLNRHRRNNRPCQRRPIYVTKAAIVEMSRWPNWGNHWQLKGCSAFKRVVVSQTGHPTDHFHKQWHLPRQATYISNNQRLVSRCMR